MKYYDYEVASSFVDGSGTIKWEFTGNGEYIIGAKKGVNYFIKRNMHLRAPTPSDPDVVYEMKKKTCDAIENKQKALKNLMSGIDPDVDRILVEENNFWDCDNKFVTITRHIGGTVSYDTNFNSLSLDDFLFLATDLTERIAKLHSCHVIHGDLKPKNFLFKSKGSSYESYLLDFDSSYPEDEVPYYENIGGTAGYQSPEILIYYYGDGSVEPTIITNATDIFTLGIIFHELWTGAIPKTNSESHSVGEAVAVGHDVYLDKKLNVQIGKNNGATLISLINWMFSKEPSDRPTAIQVLQVLQDKLAVPVQFHKGNDVVPFDDKPWAAHQLACVLLSADELVAMGVTMLKRYDERSGSSGLKYFVKNDKGERILSLNELISEGYAKRIDATIEEPWPDHDIEFVDASVFNDKGYGKISKTTIFFKKRYIITTIGGRQFDKGADWLIQEGLARPKVHVAADSDIPWPEHGSIFDATVMNRLGIAKIEQVEISGQHRYKVTYTKEVDGKPMVNESVSGNNLILMGVIK